MDKPDKKSEHLTGQAKRAVRATDKVLLAAEQLERAIAANAGPMDRILSKEFCWSFLYELRHVQLCMLLLVVTGQAEKILEIVRTAPDPHEAVWSAIEARMASSNPAEWSGGTGSGFTEEDALAVTLAVIRSLVCQSLYGAYMAEMVERVREGQDEAFLKVLHMDRSAIACPSMAVFAARRLARAELLKEKRYLSRFFSAIKGKSPRSLRTHRKVRMALQFLFDQGLLKGQTVSKEDIAFVQEASGYSKQAGAERSLAQFVWRWRSEKRGSTQNEQNGVVASTGA